MGVEMQTMMGSTFRGSSEIERKLSDKRVLLILDDVENRFGTESDVRYQRNSYEIAMIEHENRFGTESDKVKAWRSALNRVCALSGLHCKDDM
jgi:hypothetical protein